MPTVTVLLVNHNSKELLTECLLSLQKHCTVPLKLVIADNGTSDQSACLKQQFPQATIRRLSENRGFAHAINFLVETTTYQDDELLLILNPDTYCCEDFLSPLVAAFQNDTSIGAITPTIRTAEDAMWYAGGKISYLKGGPKHLSAPTNSHVVQQVDFISGCALLTSAKKFISASGFSERYFLYFEDADFCQRLQRAGYTLAWLPTSSIFHHVSATTDATSSRYVYLFARNRIWFMRVWSSAWMFPVFLFCFLAVRLPAALLYFVFIKQTPAQSLAFLRGTYAGLFNDYQSVATAPRGFSP